MELFPVRDLGAKNGKVGPGVSKGWVAGISTGKQLISGVLESFPVDFPATKPNECQVGILRCPVDFYGKKGWSSLQESEPFPENTKKKAPLVKGVFEGTPARKLLDFWGAQQIKHLATSRFPVLGPKPQNGAEHPNFGCAGQPRKKTLNEDWQQQQQQQKQQYQQR